MLNFYECIYKLIGTGKILIQFRVGIKYNINNKYIVSVNICILRKNDLL